MSAFRCYHKLLSLIEDSGLTADEAEQDLKATGWDDHDIELAIGRYNRQNNITSDDGD